MVPVSGDPAQGTVRVTQRIYFAHAAVMNRRRALQIDSPCLAYECLSHPQKMSATNPPARTAIAKAIVIFMASPYWGWYCASHSSTLKAEQHTTPSLGNHRQIMRFPYNKRFMPRYSIVVPLHNEQENVTDLYDRLKAVMEINGESFEIVLVDDGSTDRSFHLLREIAAVDSRVTVVRLRRNFGQTSALAAGFDHARGEYIIAMDGDLQHDPADIPIFLEKICEGYDIVSGWRKQRLDNLWLRRIPSRCANWLMAKLSGVDIHDFGTTFKAYRRDILEQVPLYGELHRFIPALASWHGASICEVPIRNVNRERGTSHYGIARTFRVFFDLLTIRFLLRYLSRPLHFFGSIGMMSIFGGSASVLWLCVEKFLRNVLVIASPGPLMKTALGLLLCVLLLLAICLLGEMQVRDYHEPSRRAPYSIDGVLRAQNEEHSVSE